MKAHRISLIIERRLWPLLAPSNYAPVASYQKTASLSGLDKLDFPYFTKGMRVGALAKGEFSRK